MKAEVIGFCKFGNDKYPEPDYSTLNQKTGAGIKRSIVNFLAEHDILLLPDTHQSEESYGAPVVRLEDGTVYRYECTLRCWGGILADAFGGDYLDYYCNYDRSLEKLPGPELCLD